MNTRESEVSRVLNELKLNNKDEYFSRRAILSMLEGKAKFLMAQKLGEKSLYRESQLYTYIPCFEFEKIDIISCPHVEFRTCRTLMKSKLKLPELVDSRFLNNIVLITSIDSGEEFKLISMNEYVSASKRKFGNVQRLVCIRVGDDLFIPDYEIQAVNLYLLTLKTESTVELSSCKDAKDCCKSYWEYPLVNSDRFAEAVRREVIQELLGTARSIPQDENPNKDSNIKSQTIQ